VGEDSCPQRDAFCLEMRRGEKRSRKFLFPEEKIQRFY